MEDNTYELINLAYSDYKEAKELFGINVNGCSLMDILSTVLIVPPLWIIYHEILELAFKSSWYGTINLRLLRILHIVFEIIIFAIPVLLVSTVYHERKLLYIFLFTFGFLLHTINKSVHYSDETKKNSSLILTSSTVDSERRGYITAFRSVVVLYTCIAILAVDLPIFPRKYAKTYLTGFSLMDIGVGLYIVSSGIVASCVRTCLLADDMTFRSLNSIVKKTVSLVVLGLLRLLFVRYTQYVVSIVEYGSDWNFFFTLAIVLGSGDIILQLTRTSLKTCAVGLVLQCYYQMILSLGLSEYMRDNKGVGWIDHNVTGVFSCFGFIGIYLCSAALGQFLFDSKNRQKLWQLWGLTGIEGITFWLCQTYVEAASRRNCNLTFGFLVLFVTLTIISAAYTVNFVYHSINVPILLDAINSNQLVVFLLANLITGVVNMTVQTLFLTTMESMIIMITKSYTVIVCVGACVIPRIK